MKTYPNQSFRIVTDLGEVTFLPHPFAEEIKNDHRFSFTTAFEKVCIVKTADTGYFRSLIRALRSGFPCRNPWLPNCRARRPGERAFTAYCTEAVDTKFRLVSYRSNCNGPTGQ